MSLQDIIKKIEEDAALKAEEIKAKAEARKQEITKESDKILARELAEIAEKSEAAKASVQEKTLAMARQEKRKKLLAAKQELVDSALEQFYTSLVEADDATYTKVLEQLVARIGEDKGTILCPENRVKLTEKVAPKGAEVKADKSVEGGIIFRSGDMEMDMSLRTLVFDEYAPQLRSYFADQLKLLS